MQGMQESGRKDEYIEPLPTSIAAPERDLNAIKETLTKEKFVTHVSERVEDHTWSKQLSAWRKALDDRLWRRHVERIKKHPVSKVEAEIQFAERLEQEAKRLVGFLIFIGLD